MKKILTLSIFLLFVILCSAHGKQPVHQTADYEAGIADQGTEHTPDKDNAPVHSLIAGHHREKADIDKELHFFSLRSSVIRYAGIELNNILANVDGVKQNDRLVLNLFEDERHTALISRVNKNVNGTVSVTALMDNQEGYVVISTTGERSLGSVYIPGRMKYFKILSDPVTKDHFLIEMDARDRDILKSDGPLIPSVGDYYLQEPHQIRQYIEKSGYGPDDMADIDLMIVYTPAARDWAFAENGGIENVIAQSMASSQLVLDNSNTLITLTLVHSSLIDYTESGNSNADLRRLSSHPDNPWDDYEDDEEVYEIAGYMDEVHDWRDTYAADLCAIFTKADDTGGLAWLLANRHGWPELAFSLTRVQQASWTYTLVHELGHNMGLHHHKEQSTQPGPTVWNNWPENEWSAGWRWKGSDNDYYCSVMTYGSGDYYDDGIDHARVPYFSNPSVSHLGAATGHPADGDNARTLREIKHVIAQYRIGDTSDLFAGGSGTENDPFLVETAHHLNNVRQYLGAAHTNKHFKQISNINLGVVPWTTGEGWQPIGAPENRFSGIYDGNGYTIRNLTINKPDASFVGLFGIVDEAFITDVTLENVQIRGYNRVGALSGYANNQSSIIRCASSGNIRVDQNWGGGLIGILDKNSAVFDSYSTVNLTGDGFSQGGLIGTCQENSLMEDTYATGAVRGSNYVGGLLGWIDRQSEVYTSYATGGVVGNDHVGGLIGGGDGTQDVVGSYWNKETTMQEQSAGGEPRTTNQMISRANFTNWDFNSYWGIQDGESYPYLKWQGGAGSHNFPSDNFLVTFLVNSQQGDPIPNARIIIAQTSKSQPAASEPVAKNNTHIHNRLGAASPSGRLTIDDEPAHDGPSISSSPLTDYFTGNIEQTGRGNKGTGNTKDAEVVLFTDASGMATLPSSVGSFSFTAEKFGYLAGAGTYHVTNAPEDIVVALTADPETEDLLFAENWEYPPASTNGIISTYFGGLNPGLTLTVDDFEVSDDEAWIIQSVWARGFYSTDDTGTMVDPADGFGFRIYKDDGGQPGALLHDVVVESDDFDPQMVIIEPKEKIVVVKGTYWLGVYAYYKTITQTSQGRWNQYMWSPRQDRPLGEARLRDYANIFNLADQGWMTFSDLEFEFSSTDFALWGIRSDDASVDAYTLKGFSDSSNLVIYPNPAFDNLTVRLAEGLMKQVKLTDLTGRTVYQQRTGSDHHVINVSGLKSGLYLMQVITDDGTYIQKLQISPSSR